MQNLVKLQSVLPTRWSVRRTYVLPTSDPRQAYFIEWSPEHSPWGEGWIAGEYDTSGVLMLRGRYNPVDIAQYALYQYGRAQQGNRDALNSFLNQAGYFVRMQRNDGGYEYSKSVPEYSAGPGWLSAMAQGEAISVLIRAWLITDDATFKKAALKAIEPFYRDVREGGVTFYDGDVVFFEEVATPTPCHILNGHLFAAFGIWEAIRAGVANAELDNLFKRSVSTLLQWLPAFDASGWSYYDLALNQWGKRHLSPFGYHNFHVAQMKVFAAMTNNATFELAASHWENGFNSILQRARLTGSGVSLASRAVLRKLGIPTGVRFRPLSTRRIEEIARTARSPLRADLNRLQDSSP
jgi:heparosan-N-sulfate-glucuronate 5-epimerase